MATREGSRKRILETAREHFLTRSYHGATLRQIAKDADVTTGSLYHYFSGKDELFVEVCADGLRNLHRRLQTAGRLTHGRPTWERFLALFDAYATFYIEERGYYDLVERVQRNPEMFNIGPELQGRIQSVSESIVEEMRAILNENDPDMDDEESQRRVLFAVALAEGLVSCDRRGLLSRFSLTLGAFRGTIISTAKQVIQGMEPPQVPQSIAEA